MSLFEPPNFAINWIISIVEQIDSVLENSIELNAKTTKNINHTKLLSYLHDAAIHWDDHQKIPTWDLNPFPILAYIDEVHPFDASRMFNEEKKHQKICILFDKPIKTTKKCRNTSSWPWSVRCNVEALCLSRYLKDKTTFFSIEEQTHPHIHSTHTHVSMFDDISHIYILCGCHWTHCRCSEVTKMPFGASTSHLVVCFVSSEGASTWKEFMTLHYCAL